MIQQGSMVKVTDRTGVMIGQCIRVFGPIRKRIAFIGDMILLSVKVINPAQMYSLRFKRKRKYLRGSLSRALLIRSKVNFLRMPGILLKFDENAVVFVNKKKVPVTNRVFGPVLKELCMRLPSLGCVTRFII